MPRPQTMRYKGLTTKLQDAVAEIVSGDDWKWMESALSRIVPAQEVKTLVHEHCDFLKKQIAVRPGVDPLQAVKTLVHELAHALLHGDGEAPSRDIAEVEVESVAFVVPDASGLASDDYSFPYVARWSNGDTDKLRETGERVVRCARVVLDGILGED